LGDPCQKMVPEQNLIGPSAPRIVFLAGTLGLGGAERQLFYQSLAWRRLGASVRVISFRGDYWEGLLREAGAEVISLARFKTPVSRVLAIARELKRRPAEVLQSCHFFVNPHAILAARLAGIPEVCAVRSSVSAELRKLPWLVRSATLNAARWIACNSRAAMDEARARGIPDPRLLYCPNAVDRKVFHPPAVQAATRWRPRILGIGRLVPEKRFDRFLRIVAAVRQTRDVEAVLVGDGCLRGELEDQAASLGLMSPAFRFEPATRNVPEIYRNATLLLQTSETEGLSNVSLEAMASGLPVVAANSGGTVEAVDHGVTGFLVDGEDLAEYQRRILSILDDSSQALRMGRCGLERIARDYCLERLPGRLEKMYQRVLPTDP